MIQTILEKDHTVAEVKRRLSEPVRHSYLSDAVLGGVDGCITTFAIVSSSVGMGLPSVAVLILGIANIVADGFSMAASNYQAVVSRRDYLKAVRASEEKHIDLVPEGEKEEVRQIFARKGFEGDVLEQIVQVITADRDVWVDTMLKDEHGLQTDIPSPLFAAIATFLAFLSVGLMPLIPFMLPVIEEKEIFPVSITVALSVFLVIGAVKGKLLKQSMVRAALQTFSIGGVAAGLAYLIGDAARNWVAVFG